MPLSAIRPRIIRRDGDISNIEDYEQFRELLMLCLKQCYDALQPGGRLAVLVGAVRRQGRYTAIIKDVLNFPHGEIRSVIIKVQHNCMSDRKQYGKLEDVPIRHEYCVVFRKAADGAEEWTAVNDAHSGVQPSKRPWSHRSM